jgi:hypothetical protein
VTMTLVIVQYYAVAVFASFLGATVAAAVLAYETAGWARLRSTCWVSA